MRKIRKKIALCVTGSIAAYKALELIRLFRKRGYHVRVAMSEGARAFVSPLSFATLSGNPVSSDLWREGEAGHIGHIELADWADCVVVAPATADTICKFAIGAADSYLLATLLATKAPIVVAPAMNVNMLSHPATQQNLSTLRSRGVIVLGTESGDLACGWKGEGRLLCSRSIVMYVERELSGKPLAGKKFVVTAGPTREPIDPVRFISNRSSGKMGIALSRELFRLGGEVTLIHGPLTRSAPQYLNCVAVTRALEMKSALELHTKGSACVFMAAAVADYQPFKTEENKIKSTERELSFRFKRNPDLIAALANSKGAQKRPLYVAFALESEGPPKLFSELKRKRRDKNVDFIVGNIANEALEGDKTSIWIVSRDEKIVEFKNISKRLAAFKIVSKVLNLD